MNRPFAAPLPALAPRTVRLVAVLVDLLISLPLLIIWTIAAAGSVGLSLGAVATHLQARPWLTQLGTALVGTAAWVALLAASLALGLLTLYQGVLLATRGQTIGKRLLGIRIVDLDGRPAGFVSALLMRSLVFSFVMSLVVSFTGAIIPFAGLVFWFLDYLPAFGEDRRCAHDYFAGTQVRWVRVVHVYVGRIVGATAAVGLISAGVFAALQPGLIIQPALVQPAPTAVVALVPATPIAPVVPSQPVVAAPERAVEKQLYQFTDADGVLHVTDDLELVPAALRPRQ